MKEWGHPLSVQVPFIQNWSLKPLEKSSSLIQIKWLSWRGYTVLSGNKDASRLALHRSSQVGAFVSPRLEKVCAQDKTAGHKSQRCGNEHSRLRGSLQGQESGYHQLSCSVPLLPKILFS